MLLWCIVLIQWTFFFSKSDEVDCRSSTVCDKQVCTHGTLWCQRYITTSKEYLSNIRTLLIYFELVFLQPQLVKISCKLIAIWLSCERQKKRMPFLWNTVYILCQSVRLAAITANSEVPAFTMCRYYHLQYLSGQQWRDVYWPCNKGTLKMSLCLWWRLSVVVDTLRPIGEVNWHWACLVLGWVSWWLKHWSWYVADMARQLLQITRLTLF